MEIHPYHESIGNFFREDYIFDIPKYQRNYAWDESEVSDFVDDLRKCYEIRSTSGQLPHFFGGIVSVEERLPGERHAKIHIIDGQQRLTTFVILVANIVAFYRNIITEIEKENVDATEEQRAELSTYKQLVEQRIEDFTRKYLFFNHEVNRTIVVAERLTVSEPDQEFFKALIRVSILRSERELLRESHKRLYNAFERIKSFLGSKIQSLPTILDKIDALRKIGEILNEDFTVIHMVTKTKAQAYRLFQVLNDRGVGLTVGDLLRARTLEMLDPSEYQYSQECVQRAWDDILADHPSKTEDFLRWYYASVKGKRPGNTSLFDDFLDAFFPQSSSSTYVVQSSSEAKSVADAVIQLKEAVVLLRILTEGEWPYPNSGQPITQWHKDRLKLLVSELNHTNCMPILLSATLLEDRQFSEIVQLIERFVFRYKIICNQHISPLTEIYNKQAQTIRAAHPSGIVYRTSSLRDALRSLQVEKTPDSVFSTHLNELVYQTRGSNKPLKYFLMTLEHYARWYYDGATRQPECRDTTRVFDFANTTIEHIYPQNSSSPDTELENLINSLGNLTFLGADDNNAGGNKSFSQKKPIFESSSVLLNRKIAENSIWSKTEVEEHQAELIRIALKVFSV